MEDKIRGYLRDIEKNQGISILLACETGSRAWGFPSPDSDYDVRVVYKHKTEWYLGLKEQKDSIELMLDNNEVDISGWDLRKVMRLLWKSNPPLLERIQSPILYHANQLFLEGINKLAKRTYSKVATMHHYLSMAQKIYVEIKDSEEYKLKKFFYCLRASVACKWILDREEIPPIVFPQMLEGLDIHDGLKARIYELIHLKAGKSEAYTHPHDKELIGFIGKCLHRAELDAKKLPPAKAKMSELNRFFIQTLGYGEH